jgi:hypothetical protein
MSWLKKIVATISGQSPEQIVAGEALQAVPKAGCLTAEAAPATAAGLASASAEAEDEGKQRRYYVKKGLYVDNAEERAAAARAVETASEETPDRQPVDLKTLFPKLSLR